VSATGYKPNTNRRHYRSPRNRALSPPRRVAVRVPITSRAMAIAPSATPASGEPSAITRAAIPTKMKPKRTTCQGRMSPATTLRS